MGQRLVITVETNENVLAKIYYHWSGYTTSALYETKKVIDCIYDHNDETERELQLRLVHFCEENGGGITGTEEYNEHEYIQSLFPNETFKTENYSRNDGLIALSEKGMNGLQRWSEGDVYINIEEDTVDFCVYGGYESLEEYVEERKEWDDEFEGLTLEEIPDIGYTLGLFDVSDIDFIMVAMDNVKNGVARCGNEIIELIE